MARPTKHGEQTTPVRVPNSRLGRFWLWLSQDIALHPAKPTSEAGEGKDSTTTSAEA